MPLTLEDYLSEFNGRCLWDRLSRSAEERELDEQRLRLRDFGRRCERARRLIDEATAAERPSRWVETFGYWAPPTRKD